MLRGLSADVYFNVGLITIIGLAAKNAILIVEFAIEEEERGKRRIDAVKAAARLRLRPIIMTSLAFILGVVPLALAVGAGAEMRSTLGIAVFSGMLGVTLFGIFLTPVFYYVIVKLFGQPSHVRTAEPAPAVPALKPPAEDPLLV